MSRLDLYDFTFPRLRELFEQRGFPDAHASRLWKYLYREDVPDVAAMTELPARVRERLGQELRLTAPPVVRETHCDDGLTQKHLLGLEDGRRIETVLMRTAQRATACLSSQAGCALGCVFCATGQAGFERNLSTGEIVAQALHAARALRTVARDAERLRNIVVMGMGEPLLNYDAVMDALDILRDSAGLAIGVKQITISTVGVVPGIIRWAEEGRPYSLAVSLHAADQEERAALVPAARTWPLEALIDACRYYTTRLDRKIFFEWTLIEGRNDSPAQAHSLVRLLRGIPAQVNLIPLNPTAGYDGSAGGSKSLHRFREILRQHGLPVSVRQRRGIEIGAGCGQLAAAAR